jgi:lipopolysaccharide export system protein LptC
MAVAPDLYSRLVAILKVALPLVALGMLSALFLVQSDDRLGGEIVFSRADLAALGSGLRISDATFSGTTRTEDRFQFVAASVVPDAAPPTHAAITDLSGSIEIADGPSVSVAALSGELDIAAQRLRLDGEIDIETSDGYRMRTQRMDIDLRAGTLDAGEPVLAEGPLGRIESRTLSITPAASTGDARRFLFGNGVRVLYDPPAPTDRETPCTGSPAC